MGIENANVYARIHGTTEIECANGVIVSITESHFFCESCQRTIIEDDLNLDWGACNECVDLWEDQGMRHEEGGA